LTAIVFQISIRGNPLDITAWVGTIVVSYLSNIASSFGAELASKI
jgi:hypothetical protein